MLYSAINDKEELYISFHCEQVYQDFDKSLDENYLGYFSSELKIETIERVKKHLLEIDTKNNKHIIIDCEKIIETRNPESEFSYIIDFVIEQNLSLSLIRVGEKLYSDFRLKSYKQKLGEVIKEFDSSNYTDIFINKKKEIDTINFDDKLMNLYNNIFSLKIKEKYLVDNPKRYSDSSNIYLPKYINVKNFIEEREITYLGLYLLCKKAINEKIISNLNEREKTSKTKLFFQSMNGAYISSILSKIALLDMAFIDHIGPINKIYRTILRNNFDENDSYIIVSDVICMGTETEIAKSLIHYENSDVKGSITIVKIEPIVKDKKDKVRTCSLFTLTNDNNSEIKYEISTEFEPKSK